MTWPMVKLGDVATLINGRAYKQTELLSEGKYRVLRVGNFFSNRDWYYSDLELPNKSYCENGDLLYAWSASFGPRIWNEDKVIYHYHIWKIELNDKLVDKRYLYHALAYDVDKIKLEQGSGSTMIHVTKAAMEDRYIPLPPLAEQKRIAAILDKADAIRQKRQQAIALADQFLRSVFLDMFGDMFSTIGYQLSHKKKIKQITTYIDYRGKTPEKSDSGIPLITAKNVKVGYISEEPKEFIPADNYTSWMTRGKPESKDVLFTTEAPLGNVALLGTYEKVAIGQRIVALRPKDNIRSEYLMFSLLHPFTQGLIESRSSGSTAKGIRTKELYDIEIPLAELSKQDEFAKIYWYIISMANKISESDTISDTLTNALSSKAFSGQL